MRLSVRVRYSGTAALEPLLLAAEEYGYDGFWVSEPWGVDASALLGWCAARTRRIALGTHVASVYARTPAATAAMAATLQDVSGGRFRLGLGTSGPHVVEGWHGVPFERPLARIRETVAAVRTVVAGEPVSHRDRRPLRTALPGDVPPVPVYVGALGPRNQELTADVADGWTPTPFTPDEPAFALPLTKRLAGNDRAVAVAPTVPAAVGDAEAVRALERGWSALYLRGMGDFYAAAAETMGFGAMVAALRAAPDRAAAKAAVTDDYVDAIGLFGPPERIRERATRYVAAGVDELVVELRKPHLDDQLNDLRVLVETLKGL
ncbi:LLM class F420-dependent oxidoreductase [Sporichthya brevicatena]|uniref:LLM class F420-dependent oxidoreductase n=1 Tax=Sporichthya brevicatena TaxID=171442 RepID=A0ABN1GS35_9ACTN